MSLETGNCIQDLVATNPVGATDFVSQGDDHMRLIKACVKGSFPSLGATAVSVTAEKLNFTAGLTSDAQTQLDAKQALDTDLTAIAALTTTSHGRGFLTQADAAASRTYIGAQADDADLTAIAALTTQAFGRSLLTAASATAALGLMAAGDVNWTGTHQWASNLLLIGTSSFRFYRITTSGADAFLASEGATPGTLFSGSVAYAAIFGSNANTPAQVVANGVVRATFGASGGLTLTVAGAAPTGGNLGDGSLNCDAAFVQGRRLGFIDLKPQTGGFARGEVYDVTTGKTLNTSDMAEGYTFGIYNNSAGSITLTQGSGVTLRLHGTTTTGNRTIAPRGFVTIWCRSNTEAIAMGDVT